MLFRYPDTPAVTKCYDTIHKPPWVSVRINTDDGNFVLKYGIMTEELVICETRIDEATGQGDSDSGMRILGSLCHLNYNQLKY